MQTDQGSIGQKMVIQIPNANLVYFWIADPDPDPTRVKGWWRFIIMLVIASPPAKTTKIEPEKIKNLIKILSNERC